jgi:hypothetical protein
MVKECVHELLLIYDVSNRTELAGLLGGDRATFETEQGWPDGQPVCTVLADVVRTQKEE